MLNFLFKSRFNWFDFLAGIVVYLAMVAIDHWVEYIVFFILVFVFSFISVEMENKLND